MNSLITECYSKKSSTTFVYKPGSHIQALRHLSCEIEVKGQQGAHSLSKLASAAGPETLFKHNISQISRSPWTSVLPVRRICLVFAEYFFCHQRKSFKTVSLLFSSNDLVISQSREIHNLDPQPHRHCMLASTASAPRVTRCSLGLYWSRYFFQKEAGRMLPGWLAGGCHPI